MVIGRKERKQLKVLEKRLGVSFRKGALLKQALTHKSYANEMRLAPTANNERLEFLGDAVLELAVSFLLMKTFKDYPEGELSKLRAAIVNETELAFLAQKIELGKFLYLGRGEELTGGREKPSLLSDAFEALLGAIYFDRGFKKALHIVEKHFQDLLGRVGSQGFMKDYKTRLQEVVQSQFKTIPKYQLMRAVGPDHNKVFEVSLFIREELYGMGSGSNKKGAEQMAAKEALKKLGFEINRGGA